MLLCTDAHLPSLNVITSLGNIFALLNLLNLSHTSPTKYLWVKGAQ